jgi:hypothetical protein
MRALGPPVEAHRVVKLRCTFCHDSVATGAGVHCAACLALHHPECHAEYGRCAVHGCGERRVLVADRGEYGERPEAAPPSGKVGRRRWPLLVAVVALVLASAAAFALASHRPPEPVQPEPSSRRVVLERPAREVSLVARDFQLPLRLEPGERLVVTRRETGYTHVVGQSHGREETRFVAEPGDTIVVRAGGERLVAEPGQSIVLEGRTGDVVRIELE